MPDSMVPIAPMGVPVFSMPDDEVVISVLGAAPGISRSVAVVAAGVLEVAGAETGSLANAECAEAPTSVAFSGTAADVGAVPVVGAVADVDAAEGSAAPRPVKVDRPPLDTPVEVGSVVVEGAAVELSPAAATGTTAPVEVRAAGSAGVVPDAVDVGTTGAPEAVVGAVSDVLLGDGDLFLLKRPNMEVRFDFGCTSFAIGEVAAAPVVVGLVVLSAAAASVIGASLL